MKGKRVIGWIGTGVAVLILLVVLGSYFVLETSQFHQYVLAEIMAQGQAATGGTLEIKSWDFHVSPMVVDLDGITLHGTEGPGQKPLFQAEKLTVGVNARSLLGHKLHLTELLIEHPVVSVRVDQDGKSNLPTPPNNTRNSTTTVWDLAVAHTLLSQGEVYYNDKESRLKAELYDVGSEVRFDPTAMGYRGSLSYRRGRLQYASSSPLPHDLAAQFSVTPSGVSVNSLLFTVGSSQVSVQGEIANYNHPTVTAAYDILLHTQDFAALSPQATPSGDLRLKGTIEYRQAPNQPLVKTVLLDGFLNSDALGIVSPAGKIDFRRWQGEYHLANGDLILRNVTTDLLDGRLTGEASLEHLDTTVVAKVHASFTRISLEAARRSIKQAELGRVPLTGTLEGRLDLSWTGSVKTIRAASELAVHAALWNHSIQPASATPVDGTAHLNYDGPRNILRFHQTTLRIPATTVMVEGQLSQHSNLKVQAVASDLHQLEGLAASWQNADAGSGPAELMLAGSARLDAMIQGSIERPAIAGELTAQKLQVHGSQWSSAQLAFAANPSQVAIQNASLINARQGVLYCSAQVGLKNWTYLPSSPITANLRAQKMSLLDLEQLDKQRYPIAGTLSADVVFQGSQLNPSGHGSLEVVSATAYDEPIQNLGVRFQAAGNSIDARLNLSLPAGSATAVLNYVPETKAYQVQMSVPGLAIEKLHAVQARNWPLSGTLTASATGRGTLDDPQLAARLEIPQLEMQQSTVRGLKTEFEISHQHANFTLGSNISQTQIQAKGTIDLRDGYYTEVTLDTSKIPLEPLLALYAPSTPPGFQGATDLHLSLKGPLKDKSRLEVHVTIPTLAASYQTMRIENVGPIRMDYRNSVVVLQAGELRGTDTSLRFQGRIPLAGTAAMSLNAQGTVNLQLLSMITSDVKAAGTLGVDVRTTGTVENPDVEGQIQIKDATVSARTAPVSLEKLNGTLDVTLDKLQIRQLTGQMGGGQISLGGSIVYRPSLQFNLALQGRSVRLLYPGGVRIVLDSNLIFAGTTQSSSLGGQLLIGSLYFAPDFDLSNFANQFSGVQIPPTGESPADHVRLRVAVQTKQSLAAASGPISLEGAANLQVIGAASNPVLIGRIDLSSGEFFFLNNRYSLELGTITFADPNTTRPLLNVQVTTTVEQYNVTVSLKGPINKLTTSYTSDPPLSTANIISLLYRGQTEEEAAAAGTSTNSILASQVTGTVSGGIQKLVGISSLQISPLLGGNNTNPTARIALQQRVTKNFLFTFSTDVSQPGTELVQGEYRFNPRWSVSFTRDETGGVAMDGRYHTQF
ncbi:MAG TPA: translocation/assembly module TamB domain-containing protein [Terriglobales bacterium]|nr:translocation/assembly module TamB domain-containing protein [Terriglobales bacterium]